MGKQAIMLKHILLVGIGGAAGSVLRYVTTLLTARYFTGSFPLATFMANVVGCLLIGLLIGYLGRGQTTDPQLRLLLITGFCGGYTTFSTFTSEHLALFQSGQHATALVYIAASILTGLLAVWAGLWLARM